MKLAGPTVLPYGKTCPKGNFQRLKAESVKGGVEAVKKLIATDGELQLIHYYVQRGFDWDRLAALSVSEKVFLKASMELAIKEETEKYKAILGGGK